MWSHRLTLAMDSTVINSRQILRISPKSGLRIGLDGRLSHLLFPAFFSLSTRFLNYARVIYAFDNFDYFIIGFFPLVEPRHTDPWKILHMLWHAFIRMVELYRIITWYSTCDMLIMVDRINDLFTFP